jgi:hypothetical protein
MDGTNFKQVIGSSNQNDDMHRGSIAVSPSDPSTVTIATKPIINKRFIFLSLQVLAL